VKESTGVISNFGLKERLDVQLLFKGGGEKSEFLFVTQKFVHDSLVTEYE